MVKRTIGFVGGGRITRIMPTGWQRLNRYTSGSRVKLNL